MLNTWDLTAQVMRKKWHSRKWLSWQTESHIGWTSLILLFSASSPLSFQAFFFFFLVRRDFIQKDYCNLGKGLIALLGGESIMECAPFVRSASFWKVRQKRAFVSWKESARLEREWDERLAWLDQEKFSLRSVGKGLLPAPSPCQAACRILDPQSGMEPMPHNGSVEC